MEICKNYTSAMWKKLRPRFDKDDDQEAWAEAIGVFERRMQERFFRCIDQLVETDDPNVKDKPIVPGFSIMALSCLLIETLQSFYKDPAPHGNARSAEPCNYPAGPCVREPSTARAFKDFLKRSNHFNKDFPNSEIRGDFAVNVRNALLHEAETRHGWLIRRCDPSGSIVRGTHGSYVLNRTNFYIALKNEFREYLDSLRRPSNGRLRKNFLGKMDMICQTAPEAE